MVMIVQCLSVVWLVLLCHVSLTAAGPFFNASTLQALHVVNGPRYEQFLRMFTETSCYLKDGGRASDRIVANTKERLPDMRSLLPRLANQTILFAGDSVMRNQYVSFAALVWEADDSCIKTFDWVHSGRWNVTVVFHSSIRILALHHKNMQKQGEVERTELSPSLLEKISGKFKYPFGFRVPTILFLSTAHHWTRQMYMHNISPDLAAKVDMVLLRAGVARSNILLKPFSHSTRIIWRAVASRHFMSGEWDSGGSCNRTVPYSPEELAQHMKYDKKFSPLDSIEYSAVLREEAASSGYEYVDILPYSVPRSDGLVSTLHEKEGVTDCTHYCVPGVPDVWNTAFLDHILTQLSDQRA